MPYILPMASLTRKTSRTPEPAKHRSSARLEARIPVSLKELITAAAHASGHTKVTTYIIQTLQESASRTVEQSRHARLNAAESAAFVRALLAPAAPTPALDTAFARYREAVR